MLPSVAPCALCAAVSGVSGSPRDGGPARRIVFGSVGGSSTSWMSHVRSRHRSTCSVFSAVSLHSSVRSEVYIHSCPLYSLLGLHDPVQGLLLFGAERQRAQPPCARKRNLDIIIIYPRGHNKMLSIARARLGGVGARSINALRAPRTGLAASRSALGSSFGGSRLAIMKPARASSRQLSAVPKGEAEQAETVFERQVREAKADFKVFMTKERQPLQFAGLKFTTTIGMLCGHASFGIATLVYLETDPLTTRLVRGIHVYLLAALVCVIFERVDVRPSKCLLAHTAVGWQSSRRKRGLLSPGLCSACG